MMKWEIGDLVRLSAREENTLVRDTGCSPKDIFGWEYGVIVEVCTNHGNPPFYQVHWTPSNEIIEESCRSIINISKDESR